MDSPSGSYYGYRLAFMLAIVGINAFLAAAEIAIVSVRPSRLKQLAEDGHVGAQAALLLLSNQERLLSVTQVGLTLTSLCLGWLGEETLHGLILAMFGPIITPVTSAALSVVSVVLAFLIMTYLHVVLGEVVPKNLAMDKADRVSVILAPILLVFYKLTEPFVWVLERSSTAISRFIGVHGHQHGAHSPEELKFVVSASHSAGHLTEFEGDAIQRVIELQDHSAREVMMPRGQMVTVNADADIDEVLRLASESWYSRLPVVNPGDENPIGFVHVKDVLAFWTSRRQSNTRRRAVEPFSLQSILKKAPIVPESRELHLLLEDLRQQHAHIAFVVDEFGTVTGLLTIEDVLEQIFGEIEDEFDVKTQPPPEEPPDLFEVEGTLPLRDLETQYGIELPGGEEYETVAGYLLFRLGHIPGAGEAVEYGGRRFQVLEMEFNRIARVQVEQLPPPPAPELQ